MVSFPANWSWTVGSWKSAPFEMEIPLEEAIVASGEPLVTLLGDILNSVPHQNESNSLEVVLQSWFSEGISLQMSTQKKMLAFSMVSSNVAAKLQPWDFRLWSSSFFPPKHFQQQVCGVKISNPRTKGWCMVRLIIYRCLHVYTQYHLCSVQK